MKLIDPSDEELNSAFAEKIAGWVITERRTDGAMYGHPNSAPSYDVAECPPGLIPNFARSADAVLPHLEKMGEWSQYYHKGSPESERWSVGVDRIIPHGSGWAGQAKASTFARATTIALLRAHGTEVEFTK